MTWPTRTLVRGVLVEGVQRREAALTVARPALRTSSGAVRVRSGARRAGGTEAPRSAIGPTDPLET